MHFWRLVWWDCVMLWRSGAAAATVLLLLAAAALASYTGLSTQTAQKAAITQAQSQAAAVNAPSDAQSPHAIRMRIMVEAPPLIDFATGRAGLDPTLGEATPLTPLHRVFENYQIDNPIRLALARFDFAFLVSVIAPLVLIALCAGALSEDRRTGRLALLVAHGARPNRILLARVTARWLLVAAPLGAALITQAFLGGGLGGARGLAFAMFVGVAVIGLLFWAGLCVAVNTIARVGAASTSALFATWLVFAAVGPSAITAGAQALTPPPARLAFLAEARSAEIAAVKNAESLAQAFLNDHPELEQRGFDVPAWAKSRFVVSESIDDAVAPMRNAFEANLAQQMAFATSLQALTPTLSQSIAMTDAAGTGVSAALQTQSQARAAVMALRGTLGRAIMAGRGIEPAEAQHWGVRLLMAPSLIAWPSLAWLLVWVIGVWGLALWGMRRATTLQPD